MKYTENQTKEILWLLLKGHKLTVIDALNMTGTPNLRSRLSDIRKVFKESMVASPIQDKFITSGNSTYKEYWIDRKNLTKEQKEVISKFYG